MYESIKILKNSFFRTNHGSRHRPYLLIVNSSTDTSDINGGLGAMLCHTQKEGQERVIAYTKCKPWNGSWTIERKTIHSVYRL
jgi:hypothetical protein